MSQISINGLTFSYATNHENIFENVSMELDTDWKLGLIGRNGRGKTTFLKILTGELEYSGTVSSPVGFDYFPSPVKDIHKNTMTVVKNLIAPFSKWEEEINALTNSGSANDMEKLGEIMENYNANDGYVIEALIEKEIRKLGVGGDVLERPFNTLSNGERTKLQIAAMFLKNNKFLLIDEPTNHLDIEGREIMEDYLSGKKGFILVSHDRMFLDAIIDHVMSINKSNIDIVGGNFSTWQENKDRQDKFEIDENQKLKKDIKRLKAAFERGKDWSDKVESSKIGNGPTDTGRIGHLAAKAMKRAKNIENRQIKQIDEKSKLLKNIDEADSLKIKQIAYHKKRLISVFDLSISYDGRRLFKPLTFSLDAGERLALVGKNGSGKTSVIKLLLGRDISYSGRVEIGSGLKISYVSQDTSHLKGDLKEFCRGNKIDETLFKAILRKLDFSRVMFEKDISKFSEGQKKKTLIAKSLSEEAHLYIWDEPMNFIDVLSRIQIEELISAYQPTMIFVEHDRMFVGNIATSEILLKSY